MRFPLLLLLAVSLVGVRATAQQAAPSSAGGTVRAIVHDSLAGGPLARATVQLVSATDPMAFSRIGDTDSLGRVTFPGIPRGRYWIGFMHPLLDGLGITAPNREVQVDSGGDHLVALAVPSPARLRVAVCGPAAARDSSGVLIGTVRDPRDLMPLADATVIGGWREFTFRQGGIRQTIRRIAATTGPNGWFALCGLPDGIATVSARRGTDSTHAIDLQVQPWELQHRALYVSAPGRARLQGRVIAADSARGLAGARVAMAGGPGTETDALGAWALADLPLGTQMLEVRAIGYYPERRPVDITAEMSSVDIAMVTFQAVLETVRAEAARNSPADPGGFSTRRRTSGMGYQLDATQIARRNPIFTSDLLRTLPGFIGDGSLMMKGNFSDGEGGYAVDCPAEVYIDEHLMRGISAAELDELVEPQNIVGLEVYAAGAPRPPQFDSGMGGCGVLVIWQKPLSERVRRRR